MKTKLDYNDGISILGDSFRISPSNFNTFMSKPHKWYRQQVIKEDVFTDSTATVLGTVVHFVAESYVKKLSVEDINSEILKYVYKFVDNVDVDIEVVLSSYKPMANLLVNDYVAKNNPTEVEEFIYHDLGDNIVVGGSVDARYEDIVVDYKTTNSKTLPSGIPQGYKYQLLIYAWVYRQLGITINRVRLVYVSREIDGRYISEKTGRNCGKIYPPQLKVITEEISDEDLDFIESLIYLCKDTYIESIKQPNILHLLYKDPRLKNIKGNK